MSKPKVYKNAAKQALFVKAKEAVVYVVNAASGWSGNRESLLKKAVEGRLGQQLLSQAMFDFALRDSWEHDETISSFGNGGHWSYYPKRDATFIAIDQQGTVEDVC